MNRIIRMGILSNLVLFTSCFSSCNYFTYRPHSAKQKYFARPHVQFMMAVVSFRETRGFWPPSLAELGLYSKENRKVIDDFQYLSVDFKIKNEDKMTAYFSQYKKDADFNNNDPRIDLNAFSGRIFFYKSGDKFVWKVKMR
jgi:hypothetical protein